MDAVPTTFHDNCNPHIAHAALTHVGEQQPAALPLPRLFCHLLKNAYRTLNSRWTFAFLAGTRTHCVL